MGYELRPKNKKVDSINVGAFSWPIILQESGAGYLIGYGKAMSPSSYVYQTGNHGSPVSNDGYIVSSSEAKAMAKIFRGYVSVKEFINKEWDSLDEDARAQKEEWNEKFRTYERYTGEKFMNSFKKLADFMEICGGFSVH